MPPAMDSDSPQPRFSQEIKALLERLVDQPLTLAHVLSETAERGFCLVIGLLVLPFLFPMPPGFTTILGSACLLLSAGLRRQSPAVQPAAVAANGGGAAIALAA